MWLTTITSYFTFSNKPPESSFLTYKYLGTDFFIKRGEKERRKRSRCRLGRSTDVKRVSSNIGSRRPSFMCDSLLRVSFGSSQRFKLRSLPIVQSQHDPLFICHVSSPFPVTGTTFFVLTFGCRFSQVHFILSHLRAFFVPMVLRERTTNN